MLQTQNRILWEIKVAVRACRRKWLLKRETARYIGVVERKIDVGCKRSLVQNYAWALQKMM